MGSKTATRLKKIPQPEIVFLKGNKQAAICPHDNVWIPLREKKKDGTASGFEWVRHYDREHAS